MAILSGFSGRGVRIVRGKRRTGPLPCFLQDGWGRIRKTAPSVKALGGEQVQGPVAADLGTSSSGRLW